MNIKDTIKIPAGLVGVPLPISSSFITRAYYDAEDMTLTLTFKDGTSHDYLCPIQTYLAFMAADSKGAFFNATWRRSE